ncbi:IS21 family transposase [Pendulispora albinea]|uniref:IS21 family transposase n=1 Tax=Pendulispora albinea TaxID=2741071 RepID=A0ABZ2MAP9_9BACT
MIAPELRSRIRRLFFAEHWKIGTIAAELRLHRDTVEHAIEPQRFANVAYRASASMLDPYKAFIRATLETHPRLRATRVLEMIAQRGYEGSVWPLRRYVRRVRPISRHEAFFRLTTLPGEQAQVDWGSFGSITIGETRRPLSCFVMVLSYSRAIFARFVLDQTLESFLRCHVAAFHTYGGVPRALLYDNLKTAVLERVGDVIRFHPRLLDLAGHYHFSPQPVAPARGNQKGRVERAIRYLRESFFAARAFRSVEELNRKLDDWIGSVAHARIVPGDLHKRTIHDALEQERGRLLALPEHPFLCDYVRATASGKSPYIRFDGNDYSIPHTLVRKPLTLVASDALLRILDGDTEVARYPRSWEKGRQIETPQHLTALADEKRRAREHRGRNRLFAVCTSAEPFLHEVARHGGHLGGTTTRLLHLLEEHGESELQAALSDAHRRGAFTAQSVAHILDQRRRARGAPLQVPPVLPNDPRVRDIVVAPRSLAVYDKLAKSHDGEDEP